MERNTGQWVIDVGADSVILNDDDHIALAMMTITPATLTSLLSPRFT